MPATFRYVPVGLDLWDPRPYVSPGQLVTKTEQRGCPKNGTMGHCYVADAATGRFLGLVLMNSLERVR